MARAIANGSSAGNTRRALLVMIGVAGLLLAGAGLAWACTPQADIGVSPRSGEAGSQVVVSGTQFKPGPVELAWDGQVIGVAQGPQFSKTVTVPDVEPGAYTVVAEQGIHGDRAPFEVRAGEPSDPGGPSGGSDPESPDRREPGTQEEGSGDTGAARSERDSDDTSPQRTNSGDRWRPTAPASADGSGDRPASDSPQNADASPQPADTADHAPDRRPSNDSRSAGREQVGPQEPEGQPTGPAAGEPARVDPAGGDPGGGDPAGVDPDPAGGDASAGGEPTGSEPASAGGQSQPDSPPAADADTARQPTAVEQDEVAEEPAAASAGRADTDARASAPAAAPSARSSLGELWSGFEGGDNASLTQPAHQGTASPAETGGGALLTVAIGLLAAGVAVLALGGLGMARRRVPARASATRPR